MWPSVPYSELCSAFHPSKCTHTAVNTHPEQWAAIFVMLYKCVLNSLNRGCAQAFEQQGLKSPQLASGTVALVTRTLTCERTWFKHVGI